MSLNNCSHLCATFTAGGDCVDSGQVDDGWSHGEIEPGWA